MQTRSALENFNAKIAEDISQEKLTVLVFVNVWETFNQAVAEIFEKLKSSSEFSSKCKIHLIDIEKDYDTALNYSVVISPSIVLFWKGKQLRISRKKYEEDTKYVGIAKTVDYTNLLKSAIESGPKYLPVVCE